MKHYKLRFSTMLYYRVLLLVEELPYSTTSFDWSCSSGFAATLLQALLPVSDLPCLSSAE